MGVDSSYYHNHPQFDLNEDKIRAREALISFYYEITGKRSIPKNGQYWTLCSNQSLLPGSEIEQLCAAKFIKKKQFYGVDISSDKILRNKIRHPTAHWLSGEWTGVILENLKIYNPSVVYLDSCSVLEGYPIINLTITTLEYTQSGIVFVNMMKNNPHSGEKFSLKNFISTLVKNSSISTLNSWDLQKKEYTYSSTDKTRMITLIFTRNI